MSTGPNWTTTGVNFLFSTDSESKGVFFFFEEGKPDKMCTWKLMFTYFPNEALAFSALPPPVF